MVIIMAVPPQWNIQIQIPLWDHSLLHPSIRAQKFSDFLTIYVRGVFEPKWKQLYDFTKVTYRYLTAYLEPL